MAADHDVFASMLQAVQLTVRSPRGERTIDLSADSCLQIGREWGPLAALCDDNISGRHAEIRWSGGQLQVVDVGTGGAGSTNGTYINGVRLTPAVPAVAHDGAVITCGKSPPLTITVRLVGS